MKVCRLSYLHSSQARQHKPGVKPAAQRDIDRPSLEAFHRLGKNRFGHGIQGLHPVVFPKRRPPGIRVGKEEAVPAEAQAAPPFIPEQILARLHLEQVTDQGPGLQHIAGHQALEHGFRAGRSQRDGVLETHGGVGQQQLAARVGVEKGNGPRMVDTGQHEPVRLHDEGEMPPQRGRCPAYGFCRILSSRAMEQGPEPFLHGLAQRARPDKLLAAPAMSDGMNGRAGRPVRSPAPVPIKEDPP